MNMKFGETEQIILNRQINIIYKNFESKVKISQFFFFNMKYPQNSRLGARMPSTPHPHPFFI